MNPAEPTNAKRQGAAELPIRPDPDAIVEFLRRNWHFPLGSAANASPIPRASDPAEVVRSALATGDVRLVRALPHWVSLLSRPPSVPTGSIWSGGDRRRLAYICELAAALRCLRVDLATLETADRPAVTAGIEPKTWPHRIPLCDFDSPEIAASIFGERWGILEPMAFPEYVTFQKQHLSTNKAGSGG